MRFVTLLLTLATAGAQAADLLDVYEAARNNDPVLAAAEAGYDATREAVPQARAGLLPTVSVTGFTQKVERSFPQTFTDTDPTSPTFGQSRMIPTDAFNENVWQAELRQPLFNGASWFALRTAKAQVSQAEAELEATRQNLVVRVAAAYLNVLRSQDLLDSTRAEETAVKRQLEQVQQRFEVGLVARTDVLEAQALYDSTVARLRQVEAAHDTFFVDLRTLTGRDWPSLAPFNAELPVVDPVPADEELWVTEAVTNNLSLRAAQQALEAADRNILTARSSRLPTLDAVASYSEFRTNASQSFLGATDTETYSLQFNMPIWQGGAIGSGVRQARALKEQAQQNVQAQRLTVERDTRNLYRAVTTDTVVVRARFQAIQSAQSAREATQTGYEVGTRNIVDVLQAEQRLFASQFEYADSRYQYILDLLQLKQAVGGLAIEDLRELNAYLDAAKPVSRVGTLRR